MIITPSGRSSGGGPSVFFIEVWCADEADTVLT